MAGRILLFTGLVLAALVARAAPGEQWPQFRGPDAGVVADNSALPETWSKTDNVRWTTAVDGLSWSSPVVWDEHVFLTSAISAGHEESPVPGLYDDHMRVKAKASHRWVVYDFDLATGQVRWTRELWRGDPPHVRHLKNSFASETPVTDGERLYVYFGSLGHVAALDFHGKVIWSTQLGAFNTVNEMGTGASPVLHKDRLYLVNDNTSQSFITALDKRTGAAIWNVKRDDRGSWSTPVVWQHELRTEIVTAGTYEVRSYDLDGNTLWYVKGMSEATIPSPFVKDGLLYVSSGYPGDALRPVYAIRPGASGDISLEPGETSNRHIAWHQRLLGTYNTSALVYRGYYYTLQDRGFLLCHDARTGKQIYGRQRIAVGASGFTASPWAYNGKIFLLSEDGDTYVVQAGPEFKMLGKNSLDEMVMATPAIVKNSLIIRTRSKLYRIAKRGTGT